MSTALHAGNLLKDLVCASRPDWNNGVRLVGKDVKLVHSEGNSDEFGFPSTHTINTISAVWYFYYFYSARSSDHYIPHYIWTIIAVTWCLLVIYGRLYLGMHSPIDIIGGILVAVFVLLCFVRLQDHIDEIVVSSSLFYRIVPTLITAQFTMHPQPTRRTPTFGYTVYFTSAVAGCMLGVHQFPHLHSQSAVVATEMARGTIFGVFFWFWFIRRLVLGFSITFAIRSIGKRLALQLVSLLGKFVLFTDHDDFWKQKGANPDGELPKGFNQNTLTRLIAYGALGFSITGPSMVVFHALGI
jgi:sphingosine-1-phosphate phosphatase 1